MKVGLISAIFVRVQNDNCTNHLPANAARAYSDIHYMLMLFICHESLLISQPLKCVP